MIVFVFVAVVFFISGIFAREMMNVAIKEWKLETECIKKANDMAVSKAER
ncbi:hypothetical protein SAMN04488113_10483 [Alkalibacterium gilvum]|uniref:Uncharacterized protein n=1 Tax=Alkalibacterium gilvum TaxID=1130080 RepID=A0A1H6S2N9_9LACT|nr:hypothetical protein [Alkalibacterium gilvum]SEI59027.1 hypothetical protein SAMN04488113_10483 [Alkalibacterium gilvum]